MFMLGLAAASSVAAPAAAHAMTTTSATTSATKAPACGNSDLRASYRYGDSGAGHRDGWIVLTNVSGHTCRTGGFGGLSYVGHGDGTQVGAPADRSGPAYTLLVRPGQRIRAAVDEVNALNYPRSTCRPVKVDGFRVYVPNATRSQYVVHPTTGCANAKVHLLDHRSYRHP